MGSYVKLRAVGYVERLAVNAHTGVYKEGNDRGVEELINMVKGVNKLTDTVKVYRKDNGKIKKIGEHKV